MVGLTGVERFSKALRRSHMEPVFAFVCLCVYVCCGLLMVLQAACKTWRKGVIVSCTGNLFFSYSCF